MNDLPGGGYGWPVDPADCEACRESISGCCHYHRAEERRREAKDLAAGRKVFDILTSPFFPDDNPDDRDRGPVN